MRKRIAFTLVELLVVIGIIALLISILMPALSRARGQANLIDCQARMRQIGQGLQLYATEAKGLLPWGTLDHGAPHLKNAGVPNPFPNEQYWKWHYTVSQALGVEGMKDANSYWGPDSAVFIDKDTVEGQPWGWRSDYIANPRVLTANDAGVGDENAKVDNYPPARTGKQMSQRRVSQIRNASEAMAVWDGPQWDGYGNSAGEVASYPGGWQYGWGTYYVTTPLDDWAWGYYDQPIPPGSDGGDGAILQKQWNKDFSGVWYGGPEAFKTAFRFRHLGNTTLNALFVDGHVESRKVGTLKYRDLCTTPH